MQHMEDTFFVQAANITHLYQDSYLEYLKPGVKLDTWCSLRNSPLHHSALFIDAVIATAEEDIAKFEADDCPPPPPGSGSGRGGGHNGGRCQPYQSNWSDQSQDMPTWRSFGNRTNYTRSRNKGSGAPKHGGGSFRGTNKINDNYSFS